MSPLATILVALIAALPNEYAAVMALINQVRGNLSASDQATVDTAVEAGFTAEQMAVATADTALAPTA